MWSPGSGVAQSSNVPGRYRYLSSKTIYQALLLVCCFTIVRLAHRNPSTLPEHHATDSIDSQQSRLDSSTAGTPGHHFEKAHSKSRVLETETKLGKDVLRYTRTRTDLEADLLWLGLTYDNSSWGGLPDGSRRAIGHLHEIVASQYDITRTSLGLLTSSMDEFVAYKASIRSLDYAKVTIYFHPGFHQGPVVDREHRHDDDVQTMRRSEMAKLRNFLMIKALSEETHIMWLDADVWRVDPGMVRRMIKHTDDNADYGILTALCKLGNEGNYDLNAWGGTREGPRGWDLTEQETQDGELDLQGQHHVEELVKDTGGDSLIPLTTVGATILYMRSSLVEQGLNFPHQYAVGTRWNKDGWDGIESEGVCYRARGLQGGRCGVMGGSWHVSHA